VRRRLGRKMSRWRRRHEQEHGQRKLKQSPQTIARSTTRRLGRGNRHRRRRCNKKSQESRFQSQKRQLESEERPELAEERLNDLAIYETIQRATWRRAASAPRRRGDMWICRGRPRIRPIVTSAAGGTTRPIPQASSDHASNL